ncbi:MAG: hypothetical protein HRU19_01115 [Pseudobacteriovorax sp.]|nr:hypothetical protein [Pseudobacteriovorax sp.]
MKKLAQDIVLSTIAIPCWLVIFVTHYFFTRLFAKDFNPVNPLLIFTILGIVALTMAAQIFRDRDHLKIKPINLTIISSYIHGAIAVLYLSSLSPDFNGYILSLVFILGCGYIFPAIGWLGTVVFGAVFLAFPYTIYAAYDYAIEVDDIMFFGVVFTSCLASAFPNHISQISRRKFKSQIKTTNHILDQLSKVAYPHQIMQITKGDSLEDTMPQYRDEACVISFDIIESTKIEHIQTKNFLRNLFIRCNQLINENYNMDPLVSNAYRIKEMGDGFLCSVGYPFQSPHKNIANGALELSYAFIEALEEESKILQMDQQIRCGIGIAIGDLQGFYPESGTKEYDIYGRAIVLATRYERLRKILLEKAPTTSVIMIQGKVFNSLDPDYRSQFQEIDLAIDNITVRDDPAAQKVYIQNVNGQQKITAAKAV